MTPEQTLDSMRDVVVVNHERTALEISFDLKEKPKYEQRQAFAGSHAGGFFYLHRIDKFPDTAFECVVSPNGDAISSVYKNHRIFQNAGELVRARETLVAAVAQKVGLSPESVGVDDESRGRTMDLTELSTGQLIDMLAEKMGKSIVTTASHSTAGLGGINV
jgi:hypothetical protein